jgi:hypothetical protein
MEATFKGFLGRENFHLSLRTRPFTYEIIVDYQGNDPGVYARAHELLDFYRHTHTYAIVVLDKAWQGAPSSAQKIRRYITKNLVKRGWYKENVEVIVIEPELEAWIWQDSPHIAKAFEYDPPGYTSIRKWLEAEGFWKAADLKPVQPKEAFELLAKKADVPLSGAIYRDITSRISVSQCQDQPSANCVRHYSAGSLNNREASSKSSFVSAIRKSLLH